MASKKTKNTDWSLNKVLFFIIMAFSFLVGIVLSVTVYNRTKKSPITYIEHWEVIDSEGHRQETGRVYRSDRALKEDFTIVTRLPEQIQHDQLLCFQNRSNVSVFINGKLRESFDRKLDTGIPGGSLKEFYITVPLSEKDSGAEPQIVRYRTD